MTSILPKASEPAMSQEFGQLLGEAPTESSLRVSRLTLLGICRAELKVLCGSRGRPRRSTQGVIP
jgi:hypothetical protein